MIADLPMYARPENRAAYDALWALIRDGLRDRGVAAPDALAHGDGCWSLNARPDLVLGEACNLPMRTSLKGRVTLIGSSDHGLGGVPPGFYDSVFVTRPGAPGPEDVAADPAAGRFAFNMGTSHSGWAAPQLWAARRSLPPFRPDLETGGHRASARAVRDGRADLAAIDRITWVLIERHEPDLAAALRVRGRTDPAPGQSLVTAAADAAPHRAAIDAALAALPEPHRATLTLRGVVDLPPEAWDVPPVPSPEALRRAA